MQALAKYLILGENKVEGYDDNKKKDSIYTELKELGIKIYNKFNSEYLVNKEVIVTPAISLDKLKKISNFKYYNEFISDITKSNDTICVCGSFGKTTTSTFLFKILNNITGCNCIIGDGTGFYSEKNKTLVLESCEFRKHFLSYNAKDIIITNIGFEHMDCYKNFDEIVKTFLDFANSCEGNKIIYGDIKNIDYSKFVGNVFKYGFNENNNIIIKNFSYRNNRTNISLFYNNNNYFFKIPIRLAKHQILDLVACISYCLIKLYDFNQIANGLQKIELPKNRFVVEKIDGVDIISDACVHYAGITANLDEIKKRYPNKKINVIFEPIAYNRIINTFDLICEALRKADYVYVCDILSLREKNIKKFNFSVKNIVNEIKKAEYWNKKADLYFNNSDLVVIFAPESLEIIKDKIKKL